MIFYTKVRYINYEDYAHRKTLKDILMLNTGSNIRFTKTFIAKTHEVYNFTW